MERLQEVIELLQVLLKLRVRERHPGNLSVQAELREGFCEQKSGA